MDVDNLYLKEYEYSIVKSQLLDIDLATSKLINLVRCLNNNWTDFANTKDNFYDYRGGSADEISTDELIEFADNYYKDGGS